MANPGFADFDTLWLTSNHRRSRKELKHTVKKSKYVINLGSLGTHYEKYSDVFRIE